jgi:porphobilinogen synthase
MTETKSLNIVAKNDPSTEVSFSSEKKSYNSSFPAKRMRRLRKHGALRDMVRENEVTVNDLILPVFVEENIDERTPIKSLPGVYRETEKTVIDIAKQAHNEDIKSIMLFGVSHNKDSIGSDSMNKDGLLYRMISNVKDKVPEIMVMADLCFCEYTDHGHCGPISESGDVDNDSTLDNLANQAIIAAAAGADIVAPSGMMDGMVGSIRNALDQNGHDDVLILSYAAKFASAFYGPFRDAAGCSLGAAKNCRKDRKTYQMDPANGDEAIREAELDIMEGADMIMVKPGLPYLDILYRLKTTFRMPTFAYNVSGEYAMLKLASEANGIDYDSALMEMLMSFKRAGADGVLTYAALDASRIIKN